MSAPSPPGDRPVLLLHAAGAAAAWWLLPQGFPADHPRFWANTAVPLSLVALSLLALLVPRVGRAMTAGLPALWVGMACAWMGASPRTGALPALLLGLVGLLLGLRARRLLSPGSAGELWLSVALLLGAGATCALAQRAPDPSTRPLGAPEPLALREAPELRVHEGTGRVGLEVGALRLDLEPLLTFRSRSPDRGWVLFAPEATRDGPGRQLLGQQGATLTYRDDGLSTLSVGRDAQGVATIEAVTQLDAPVWSHLNTFLVLWVSGHQQLSLVFSPCPEVPVEVQPSDYPAGRPVRAAWLGEDGVFRVVEARSGEKGPFRELARGPLARHEPLGITLLDAGVPVATVTLQDWAAQASTALSPTAGWGLPDNALEFLRADADPSSPAVLFVTLASTSVGRGFDSVGHAAGTYRNRVRIEAPGGAAP
jgi:hypothetical protein